MPRNASGSVRCRNGLWYARVTLDGNLRPNLPLPTCKSEAEALARRDVLADIAKRLRDAGRLDIANDLLEAAASRRGNALAEVLSEADLVCSGDSPADPGAPGDDSEICRLRDEVRRLENYINDHLTGAVPPIVAKPIVKRGPRRVKTAEEKAEHKAWVDGWNARVSVGGVRMLGGSRRY